MPDMKRKYVYVLLFEVPIAEVAAETGQ